MSLYSAATGAYQAAPEVEHVRPAFRRDFHIAIICALPLEYDAASLLIDEFWDQGGQQYGRISGDSNTYRNGRIGMHNVVLMLLPSMGKVSVAGSAASLRASYVGVRLAFLVGVCGGVPGIREMILGDVVISDDLVQYDFGRQYPGAFVAKDTVQVHPGLSSKDVRSLVSYFRTESGRRDLQDDAVENLIGLQNSAVAKRYQSSYEYPGPGEDKLFEATYRHRHREPSPCEFCCGETERFCEKAAGTPCAELGCDTNRLVPRRRLKMHRRGKRQKAHEPEVFIGRVASADMVMKSGEHRDQFAEQYGVIAFEMEAAGIWDEIPCIVVKGVCDYADSHKSKSWQPFAAATAAAVTKSILGRYNFADNAQLIRNGGGTFSQNQVGLTILTPPRFHVTKPK